jgi:hypothetical protein
VQSVKESNIPFSTLLGLLLRGKNNFPESIGQVANARLMANKAFAAIPLSPYFDVS